MRATAICALFAAASWRSAVSLSCKDESGTRVCLQLRGARAASWRPCPPAFVPFVVCGDASGVRPPRVSASDGVCAD
jgi:hypothetical protein